MRNIKATRSKIALTSPDVYQHPGFRHTTPSARAEDLTPGEKRKLGCYEKEVIKYCFKGDSGKEQCAKVRRDTEERAGSREIFTKVEKKFTGDRCTSKSCKERVYDERCKKKGNPCKSRATCPVQLVWVKGKPNLRFCRETKKPGYLVPVRDVKQAMEISSKACAKWPYQLGVQEKAEAEGVETENWDAEFFDKNAPEVPEMARAAYPASGGLGGVEGSSIWLAAGLAAGIAAAVLIGKRV